MVWVYKFYLYHYLEKHRVGPKKPAPINKIDSIDWLQAKAENTQTSYNSYLQEHADGDHVDEANDALKALKAKTVQPEEQSAITTMFRRFFQSINPKDEEFDFYRRHITYIFLR